MMRPPHHQLSDGRTGLNPVQRFLAVQAPALERVPADRPDKALPLSPKGLDYIFTHS